ncbi:MAG TPA: hypothetical protein VFH88_12590 [Candidatus Krumholzibacteria bacterium]|nr:hypothetical protein [Candidatus Krumholzibacteria bacterium]
MRRTLELKRADIGSLFKVAFIIYATIGLVAGIGLGMFFATVGSLSSLLGDHHMPWVGFVSGAAAFVMIPIMSVCYGMIGSIVVSIVGLVYNFAADRFGGVRLEFETGDVAPAAATTAVPPQA